MVGSAARTQGFRGSLPRNPRSVAHMSRPRKSVPTYRLHRQSGQAIVTLNENGRRRDVILGKYDGPESHQKYERILVHLRIGSLQPTANGVSRNEITVNELFVEFW